MRLYSWVMVDMPLVKGCLVNGVQFTVGEFGVCEGSREGCYSRWAGDGIDLEEVMA